MFKGNHHKYTRDWRADNRPEELSDLEWKELMQIPALRESWGLEPDATVEDFAVQVYAAKFNFVSGSPGYVGDLYIVQGDALTGDPPFVLRRRGDGKLDFAA